MFRSILSSNSQLNHEQFDEVFSLTKADLNPLLVGPAGCGKTTLAIKIAEKLKLPFAYSGAVQSDFQLRGFTDAQGRPVETPFVKAYRDGGVFLLDEMDASEPQALVAVHAALDNGVFDTPFGMIKRHPNLHFIAAANTWGNGATLDYMGRNHLDGATLDRFVPIPMDYDEDFERKLIAKEFPRQKTWPLIVQHARAAARELELRHIVSTRACVKGAKMLEEGLSEDRVIDLALCKGLSPDTKVKLLEKMKAVVSSEFDLARNNRRIQEAAVGMTQAMQDYTKLLGDVENTKEKGVQTLDKGRAAIARTLELIQQLEALADSLARTERAARPLQEEADGQLERLTSPRSGPR